MFFTDETRLYPYRLFPCQPSRVYSVKERGSGQRKWKKGFMLPTSKAKLNRIAFAHWKTRIKVCNRVDGFPFTTRTTKGGFKSNISIALSLKTRSTELWIKTCFPSAIIMALKTDFQIQFPFWKLLLTWETSQTQPRATGTSTILASGAAILLSLFYSQFHSELK